MSHPDLIEQLTSQRLSRSWNSYDCPACRRGKARRKIFCVECWRRLPGHIQCKLLSSSRDAHLRGVLLAMEVLGRKRFFVAGDKPDQLRPPKEQQNR